MALVPCFDICVCNWATILSFLVFTCYSSLHNSFNPISTLQLKLCCSISRRKQSMCVSLICNITFISIMNHPHYNTINQKDVRWLQGSVNHLCGVLTLAASVQPWLKCVCSKPVGERLGQAYYNSILLNTSVSLLLKTSCQDWALTIFWAFF